MEGCLSEEFMPFIITFLFILLIGTSASRAADREEKSLSLSQATRSDKARLPSPVPEEPTGDLTLHQALALALSRHPELTALAGEERAREAAVRQTEFLPNPSLSAELEDLAGSGEFRGTDRMQTTLQLSQPIELGGKRAARRRATSLARDLAGWDLEAKRSEISARVASAFVVLLSAQQQHTFAEEAVRLAERVTSVVSERVRAGKVSPVEETKATIALTSSRIELDRSDQALQAARRGLASTWGNAVPRFGSAEGNMETLLPIPPLDQLIPRLADHPELARWEAEISQRRAVIDLERSRAFPDLTISGGIRRFSETEDTAFIVGLSLPLPIFNRNQGGIAEARERETKGEAERQAAELRLVAALTEAHRALSTAHTEATILKETLLPRAQEAFEAVNEGYRLGKFGLLDVLDAQRTLFGSRAQYLRSLTEYHKSVADVEWLTGKRLDAARNASDKE